MSNTNPKPFSADRFTDTQFYTAKDKADFGNNLVKFILNGFQWKDFSDSLYKRLSNCFMHIAHFNRRGFFDNWFSDPNQILEWTDYIRAAHPIGSASHTFSDLEREFQSWMIRNWDLISDVIASKKSDEKKIVDAKGSTVDFAIVAISDNTGDFGHKRHILVGRNGVAFSGDRQPSYHSPGNRDLKVGEQFSWEVDASGMPIERTKWFEISSRLPQAPPQAVIDEAFAVSS